MAVDIVMALDPATAGNTSSVWAGSIISRFSLRVVSHQFKRMAGNS